MIETLSKGKFTVGAKQTSKAIRRDEIAQVYLAADCDEFMAYPILELCLEHVVPVNREYTMEELGKAVSIKVGAAAVGLLK